MGAFKSWCMSGCQVRDMERMWKTVLNLACLETKTCGTEG